MIYLASYKGKRNKRSLKAILHSFQDALIRFLTRGKYSHCEIAIKRDDGKYDCYSSSLRDGGVRHKVMTLPSERWDLKPIGGLAEADVWVFFNLTKHHKYDWLGALGVVVMANEDKSKSFCSEWCYNLIFNSDQGWRFSPNDLVILVKDEFNKKTA
ncbi:enoyl-CoA hydratase [Psychrobacter sp. HD31]|uniref:enoyl-CoA hydratase n=1 Tax=Psychrobacter sp. HD31 TaxID=3112003 RepID=UPI003DA61591